MPFPRLLTALALVTSALLLPRAALFAAPLPKAPQRAALLPRTPFTGPLAAVGDNWVWESPDPIPGVHRAAGLVADGEDNVISLVRLSSLGQGQYTIRKLSPAGELLWQRTLRDGAGWDQVFSLAVDPQDNVFAAGAVWNETTGREDFAVAKWDAQGTRQWRQVIPDGWASSPWLETTALGDVVVAGSLPSPGNAQIDSPAILKLSGLDGAVLWKYQQPYLAELVNHSEFKIDPSGDVLVSGIVMHDDALTGGPGVLKLHGGTGTRIWKRLVPGDGFINALVVDPSGDLLTAATRTATDAIGVARLDGETGELEWNREFPGGNQIASRAEATDACAHPEGGFVLAGARYGRDFWVIRLNAAGDTLWEHSLAALPPSDLDPLTGMVTRVAVDGDGNLIAGGWTGHYGFGPNFVVYRWSAAGELLWNQALTGTHDWGGDDTVHSLALSSGGSVFAAGTLWDHPFEPRLVVGRFSGYHVQPRILRVDHEPVPSGGLASVTVDVEDGSAVSEATAILKVGTATSAFPLQLVGPNTFRGGVTVPTNRSGPRLEYYPLYVVMGDAKGIRRAGQPVKVAVDVTPSGKLLVLTRKLKFPTLKVGKSKTLSLAFRNPGPTELWVEFTGPTGPFSFVPPLPGLLKLSPGEKRTLRVQYQPTAAGTHTSAVVIRSSDPRAREVTIPVTGRMR